MGSGLPGPLAPHASCPGIPHGGPVGPGTGWGGPCKRGGPLPTALLPGGWGSEHPVSVHWAPGCLQEITTPWLSHRIPGVRQTVYETYSLKRRQRHSRTRRLHPHSLPSTVGTQETSGNTSLQGLDQGWILHRTDRTGFAPDSPEAGLGGAPESSFHTPVV